MLPRILGRASRAKGVPVGATLLWVALIGACITLPTLLTGAGANSVSAWEAGMGTVPVLLTVLVTLVGLPLYLRRTEPERLRPLRHLAVPAVGAAVIAWGVYGNIRPDQPPPGDTYWICTALICAVSLAAALRFARRPAVDLSALGVEPGAEQAESGTEPADSGTDPGERTRTR